MWIREDMTCVCSYSKKTKHIKTLSNPQSRKTSQGVFLNAGPVFMDNHSDKQTFADSVLIKELVPE